MAYIYRVGLSVMALHVNWKMVNIAPSDLAGDGDTSRLAGGG